MKQLLLLLLIFGCAEFDHAQPVFDPVGADAWSVGGASVASKNIFGAFNNPSSIVELDKVGCGIYSEKRFNETKLITSSIALVLPLKYIHAALSIHHFGYDLFNQQKLSLTLAKKLSKQFSLGISFSYFITNISEQLPAGVFLGEFGISYHPFSKWQVGVFVFNPTQSKYSTNSYDKVPTYARIGTSYTISDKVKFITEFDQKLNQDLVFRGGVNYQIHKQLSLSIGAANNPDYLTFGTGIYIKKSKIDFAISIHQILGISPHLSISLPVNK